MGSYHVPGGGRIVQHQQQQARWNQQKETAYNNEKVTFLCDYMLEMQLLQHMPRR